MAERANILLTWTEARGRSSFFRKHLPPIKLRVVIRFYPQSIPLTAVRIKRQAEMKTVFVIFAALMVCYAITLVERWACHLDGLFVFADTEFRSNLQIWWPHFFAGAKKSFYVHDDFGCTQRQFSENICLEDDLRSRIFGTFVL